MIAHEETPSTASQADIAIARQAIYDREMKVIGYEVLYRNGDAQAAGVVDGNEATSQVLLNALIEIGLDRLVGNKLAFVNLTRDYLIGAIPLPLGVSRLVLEILENIPIDDELVAAVAHLVSQGFCLAIDDATFHDELVPLLNLASIVKVELPAIPKSELASHVKRLRDYPVKLLAEKIESREQFDFCVELGFDYFQGFAISRPERIGAKRARACRTAVLTLLARVSDPDVTVKELEDIVRTGPVLTLKLLRYINSTLIGIGQRIESLSQAVALLGVQGVRMIATLIILSDATAQPRDIVKGVFQRASFCERLGRLAGRGDTRSYFLAGLLSAADLLLEIPIADVVHSLPLAPALKDAILTHEGRVGAAVRCAIAFEQLDWNAVSFEDRPVTEVREALLGAIEDTDRLWIELGM